MKINFHYIFALIVVMIGLISSCKKEVIPSSPPYIDQWWDKYYGTYTVFDTMNNISYEISISQMERYFDGLIHSDSVRIENLANKFNDAQLYAQNSENTGGLRFGIHNPILDKEGKRWAFSSRFVNKDDSDTIELHYTISNILYYWEDDVPLYECLCIDLAIKND